jgi:SAM-dependent methyltransferase
MPRKPGTVIEETLRTRLLRRHFAGAKYGLLLDLGCGTRPYRRLYDPACEKSIGADRPGDYFPQAGVDLHCSAEDIPLETESVDAVLLAEVLHDLAEPQKALREIFRILRPGGTLIVTSPFLVPVCDGPYDHVRYTQTGLDALLQRNGFSTEAVHPVGDLFAASIQLGLRPVLKCWNAAAKRLRWPFLYTRINPFMLLLVYLPQWIYLGAWFIAERIKPLGRLRKKFEYACIGYVAFARKPPARK